MRPFHKISPTVWQSKRFQSLPPDDGRFLLLYLLTCPHNNSAGCFWLPNGYACYDLRWSEDRYEAALQALVAAKLVDHDAEHQVVLIEQWFRHNPPMNKSHRIGIGRQLDGVPSERLGTKAFDALKALETGVKSRQC